MPVSYATELANVTHITDTISDAVSAALVQNVVVVPLIHSENLPAGTNVKKMRKAGSLTAESLAEATAYTPSANSEYTSGTPLTLTAVKQVSCALPSVEQQYFTDLNLNEIAAEEGRAIARLLDDNVLALYTSITNYVTASSVCTVEDVIQAAYTVRKSLAGGLGQKLAGVFGYKQIFEMQKQLIQASGSVWTNPELITLLTGMPQLSGYAGSLPGVDCFQTDGLPTSTTYDVSCVFNRETCLAGIYSPTPIVWTQQMGQAGFYTEVDSFVFSHVGIWNNTAGCGIRSLTA